MFARFASSVCRRHFVPVVMAARCCSALAQPGNPAPALQPAPQPERPAARVAAAAPNAALAAENAFIEDLLSKMTIEEKVGQTVQIMPLLKDGELTDDFKGQLSAGLIGSLIWLEGAEKTLKVQKFAVENSRLKIPLIFGLDVIHGYRTIFPVPLAASCSWDPELVEQAERIAATEAAAAGLHWTFAPMVDIARDARWGRIVEGAGEDPYLGSVMAVARVRGFQTDDLRRLDAVLACAKHYAAYGGAEGGRDYNSVDISERTLRDVYLPPFRASAFAGAGSFMSAFNDIGGIPATAHAPLIRGTLKRDWNWDGFVVSDWDSVVELRNHGVADTRADAARLAILAGVDMDMASRSYLDTLAESVRSSSVSERILNDAARRVLRAKYCLGLFDDPFARSNVERESRTLLSAEHRAKARDAGRRSIVLLKNDGVLPLSKQPGTIALIGALADDAKTMLGPWSPSGKPEDAVTVLAALRAAHGGEKGVLYAPGYDIRDPVKGDVDAALRAAEQAQVIIVALGEPESMSAEARSRASIELPQNQKAVYAALAAHAKEKNKPLVALMINGRPMAFPEVRETAGAIVQAWFLGVEMGNSVNDVLFGDFNPSGKLAVTFPASTGQIPLYYNHRNTGRPGDPTKDWSSKYIDFTAAPLYPFGHGLSYTTFAYDQISMSSGKVTLAEGAAVTISCQVKNTGSVAGDEVVQLYIRRPVASVAQPVKSLKGFKRVTLQPGEQKTIRFELPLGVLSLHDAELRNVVEPGSVQVMIGSSSDDIRLRGAFTLEGAPLPAPDQGTVFTSVSVQ